MLVDLTLRSQLQPIQQSSAAKHQHMRIQELSGCREEPWISRGICIDMACSSHFAQLTLLARGEDWLKILVFGKQSSMQQVLGLLMTQQATALGCWLTVSPPSCTAAAFQISISKPTTMSCPIDKSVETQVWAQWADNRQNKQAVLESCLELLFFHPQAWG